MDDELKDFREIIERAAVRLLLMPEAESRARASEGHWSAKEIVGHLIDSASNNHGRFVRAQFTDDPVFPGYEQAGWVRAQNYQEEPWPLLVELWKTYNLHLAHIMAQIPEDVRSKPRAQHSMPRIAWQTVGADELVTLEYLMLDYIEHLKNHLRQVLGATWR